MMTIMVIRGATLDGAAKGVQFYLKPDWSKLTNSEVVAFITRDTISNVKCTGFEAS